MQSRKWANTNSLSSRWTKCTVPRTADWNGFDVNSLLSDHISESYDDERKTALYFAVCNNDILCTEILLTLQVQTQTWIPSTVYWWQWGPVIMKLSGCFLPMELMSIVTSWRWMTLVSPSATVCPKWRGNAQLLLNNGYQVEMCFECMHGDIFGNSFVWSEIEEEVLPGWTSCVIKDNPVSYTLLFFVLGQHHNFAHLGDGQNSKKRKSTPTFIFFFFLCFSCLQWDGEISIKLSPKV